MTLSNIESCLEEIEDDESKKKFVALMLKLDIRLKLIQGRRENYYKIWVIRKDRKKRMYYTDYHRNSEEDIIPMPTLQEILNTITYLVDVPKSYREYNMQRFLTAIKEDHVRDLKFANRFKDVLDRTDIKSIPSFEITSNNVNCSNDKDYQDFETEFQRINEKFKKKMLENEIRRCRKLGFTTIRLRSINEYHYLLDLRYVTQHSEKLLKQYGFDETGNLNLKKFPVSRSDKEEEGIEKDITNYDNDVRNALEYVEQLARKYDKTLSSKGVIFYPPRKGRHNKLTKPLIISF